MFQYLALRSDGVIDAKGSLINIINAMPGVENAVTDIGIVSDHGEHRLFAMMFNQSRVAERFFMMHQALGSLDLTDEIHPKILLNKEDSIYSLFSTVLNTQSLLADPATPPFARVNLLELYAIQTLEPFVFHGVRQQDMKVGLQPIQFKEGKLFVTLRGQTVGNSNTIISYDDFDELALICFTDADTALTIPALKQLLFSVRKQYILERYKNANLDGELKLDPLKIAGVSIESIRKQIFIDLTNEKLQHGTLENIKAFKQLLQRAFGDTFSIISSVHWGKAILEIKPAERFLFNEADILLLDKVFKEKSEVIFLSSMKEKLLAQTELEKLKLLQASPEDERYSFEDIPDLVDAFRDSISYEIIKNPLVVDNSGISYSAATIQELIDSGNRVNPQTRQPMAAVFRENKLLDSLKNHYRTFPAYVYPPQLEGITTAVLLPNGETCNKAHLIGLFTKQNSISEDKIRPNTSITWEDGAVVTWKDIWPNLAVQDIIDFYNQPLQLNEDERVLQHPNPMLSLAGTLSSLFESPAALSKEDAEEFMQSNPSALPIHVIWGSAPAGLRLHFKSIELARLMLSLLSKNQITVAAMNATMPFKKCIFLCADTKQGQENIQKFLFDICKYNRESHYFDLCFTSEDFRYASEPRTKRLKQKAPLSDESLVFNFLRAMYYGTMEDVERYHAALPLSSGPTLDMLIDRSPNNTISRSIPAAAFISSAYTPITLLSHVSSVPLFPQTPVFLGEPMAVDSVPLVGWGDPNTTDVDHLNPELSTNPFELSSQVRASVVSAPDLSLADSSHHPVRALSFFAQMGSSSSPEHFDVTTVSPT